MSFSSISSLPVVYDLPMALHPQRGTVEGLEPKGATFRNRRNVEDSRKWTVGPMPVQEFLQCFPLGGDTSATEGMLSSRHAFNSVPFRGESPADIYQPLIMALNKTTKHKSRCPGFVFDNASARSPCPQQLGHMRPHIGLYRSDHLETVLRAEPAARADFGFAELFIEVAADPTQDFFADPPEGATPDSRATHEFATTSDVPSVISISRALGQHMSYITEMFTLLHLLHCYVRVTRPPHPLGPRWLYRHGGLRYSIKPSSAVRLPLALLPDFRCGHDTTVRVASADEEALFEECIREHLRSQLALEGAELEKCVSEHYEPHHVAVFHVLSPVAIANSDAICPYLVSRPVVSPLFLTGRGTAGFWAVDASSREVVFLKDTWRYGGAEGDILAYMNDEGVRNVPKLAFHGDVPDFLPEVEHTFALNEYQVTQTDEFCSENWVCKVNGEKPRLGKRVHYRLVLQTVGYGLSSFEGTQELLHATYDVLQAVMDAQKLTSLVHRDISLANIILVPEPGRATRKGYLIDWDASCESDATGVSIVAGRTGTWEFMSFAMLEQSGPTRRHTIEDDMESLLYVVLYCAFLWLPHGLSEEQLATTMSMFFEFRDVVLGETYGGIGKASNAVIRTYTRSVDFGASLREWVDSMMDLRWKTVDPLSTGYAVQPIDKGSDPESATNLTPKRTWTLERVDEYWSTFLQTHALPSNDRVTHNHPRSTGDYYANVDVVSYPSYGRGSPRKQVTEGGIDDRGRVPSRKRGRTSTLPANASKRVRPASPSPRQSSPVPRRSQRIAKRNQNQARQTSTTTPPVPRVARRGRKTSGGGSRK